MDGTWWCTMDHSWGHLVMEFHGVQVSISRTCGNLQSAEAYPRAVHSAVEHLDSATWRRPSEGFSRSCGKGMLRWVNQVFEASWVRCPCSILVFHGFSSYFQECFLWPHPTCFRRMLEKKDKPRPSVKELIDDPYVQATTWSNCCMVSGLLHILWPFSIFQQYGCRPKGPCLACSIRWPLVCQNDLWRKLKAEFAKVNYFLAKVWRK